MLGNALILSALAVFVYALVALLVVADLGELARGEEILAIAVVAVGTSSLLHGMTAAPGARWFGRTESVRRSGKSSARLGNP